jgi:alpha-beta hydrolase superfamily lysophospholipase
VEAGLKIDAPTLLVLGEHDVLFCKPPEHSPCSTEQAVSSQQLYFGPDAKLQAHIQHGAGHDIALELNNGQGFRAMLSWLRTNFPL